MILSALLDAGADAGYVTKTIEQLPIEGVGLEVSTVHRSGIAATSISVIGPAIAARTYSDAVEMLQRAELPEPVVERANAILDALGAAEAQVHGIAISDVHFHELSALDTIVDIVGVAAALVDLGIEELFVSPIASGVGTVQTQHGELPLPVPAVLELLSGFEIYQRPIRAELVTPTGAAIISALGAPAPTMPYMTVRSVGMGAGHRDLEIPNIVRVVVASDRRATPPQVQQLLVETNIDDMNPEMYEYVFEKLFQAGALDVWVTPAVGKRGRPIHILHVLVDPSCEAPVNDVLVKETTTLGLRTTQVSRSLQDRRWETVDVLGHQVRVKVGGRGSEVTNVAPEYVDCVEVARASGTALKEVYRLATAAAQARNTDI